MKIIRFCLRNLGRGIYQRTRPRTEHEQAQRGRFQSHMDACLRERMV